MSEESDKPKTVNVPTFNGKNKSFTVWWMRFQAYAALKDYKSALKDNFVTS